MTMTQATGNSADLRRGVNDPSPVTRVLILGYQDGATDGVLQLGDGGPVYRFEMTGERHNPDGCDERTFDLRPLPTGALDRLAGVLAPYHAPRWPVWAPIWTFPSDDARSAAEAAVDAILAEAGPAVWAVTTADTTRFARLVAEPVPTARSA
jgi:hypothetical protein